MMGATSTMNFILFQNSKEVFTKYLLHKGVISFNRTEDHCLSCSSQDELKKGGHRLLCSWDFHHLFTPPSPLAIPSPSLGKPYPVLWFRKPVTPSDVTIP